MKIRTDYRELLSPEIISKIARLDLRARFIVEGFMIGLHKSPYHGFSVEFSEHRQYIPGDDVSKIDWKVFARTDKFFIKQYEEETNLKSYILIDISNSMSYTSKIITKFQYAITLGSVLAYLLFDQNDSVGLVLYSDKIEHLIESRASKSNLKEIFKTLATCSAKGRTDISTCLDVIADKIKKRGLIIIISDFFDSLDNIIASIKKFKSKQNEIIAFQILDEQEIKFDFTSDFIFKDLESSEELITQPMQIRGSYNQLVKDFLEELNRTLLDNKVDYNLIKTTDSFDKALLEFLKKRKRLH